MTSFPLFYGLSLLFMAREFANINSSFYFMYRYITMNGKALKQQYFEADRETYNKKFGEFIKNNKKIYFFMFIDLFYFLWAFVGVLFFDHKLFFVALITLSFITSKVTKLLEKNAKFNIINYLTRIDSLISLIFLALIFQIYLLSTIGNIF